VNPQAVKKLTTSEVIRKFWGYERLLPLQKEAIEAGVSRRDSLVVLPTGGGKSLCYQVPPVVAGRTDVVVSPLISLMKDQVDALVACGYPTAALHSAQNEGERRTIAAGMLGGQFSLLFVSPERLLTPWFMNLLQRAKVSSFAIDEAHCISQWGHDFRPEYRRLAELREAFPGAAIHAFTATATDRVRTDIISQLKLRAPSVLVGRFDRPNLTYKVEPRRDGDLQVLEAVKRHKDEAVIVYCISRADTERVADFLRARGVRAAAYHAGLEPSTRARTQDAFSKERIDVVVATVAFGMGIDRSNVRCVIHAAMPKSLEHYQQETGRAGRDGLEAECILFHSAGDFRRWQSILTKNAAESAQPPEVSSAQLDLLDEMQTFGASQNCRHRAISYYFGQAYEPDNCKACDACLSPGVDLRDGSEIARKVLDCIAGLRVPFGVRYVTDVLTGSSAEKIRSRRHDQLPAYGALRAMGSEDVKDVVQQLVGSGLLARSKGEMPILTITDTGQQARAGKLQVRLRAPRREAAAAARAADDWRGVDKRLFHMLRDLRRSIADERQVPPFVIFADSVLRDLARYRPDTPGAFRDVKGIGERKAADLGGRFVDLICAYCREHGLASQSPAQAVSGSKAQAYGLFAKQRSIEEVAAAIGRARSTIISYLEDYIGDEKPPSIQVWVADDVYQAVVAAARTTEGDLLRPVFEALEGRVSYDEIRLAMKHAGVR
jgi:ATP-dependent DNA helicase RecQ